MGADPEASAELADPKHRRLGFHAYQSTDLRRTFDKPSQVSLVSNTRSTQGDQRGRCRGALPATGDTPAATAGSPTRTSWGDRGKEGGCPTAARLSRSRPGRGHEGAPNTARALRADGGRTRPQVAARAASTSSYIGSRWAGPVIHRA